MLLHSPNASSTPSAGRLLHTLDLSDNRLQRLPSVLATATALTDLLLGGNPNLAVSHDDVRSVLAALPALASLTVARGVLGDRVVERISKLLPGLTVWEEAEASPEAYQRPRSVASSSSVEDDEL